MYCITVPKGISHLLTSFQYFGLWDVDKPFWSTTAKLFLLTFYASFPISIAAGAIGNSDVYESIYLADAAITISVQIVRIYYIIWWKREILTFVQRVGSCNIENNDECHRVNDKMEKFVKFALWIVVAMLIVFVLALGYYAIASERKLSFNIALPWDYKNTKFGYWTAFSYFTVEVMASAVIVSLNIIIYYLMLNYSIKYELLGNQLMRLGRITQHLFLKDLIVAIKTHQYIQQ